jgi:hypothetical protein
VPSPAWPRCRSTPSACHSGSIEIPPTATGSMQGCGDFPSHLRHCLGSDGRPHVVGCCGSSATLQYSIGLKPVAAVSGFQFRGVPGRTIAPASVSATAGRYVPSWPRAFAHRAGCPAPPPAAASAQRPTGSAGRLVATWASRMIRLSIGASAQTAPAVGPAAGLPTRRWRRCGRRWRADRGSGVPCTAGAAYWAGGCRPRSDHSPPCR